MHDWIGFRGRRLGLALASLWLFLPGMAAEKPSTTPGVVRQMDHLLIASSDAQELFSLLTSTFELPVAWPMSEYGDFASGGVAVGNVNLEILKDPSVAQSGISSRFVGFALEPEPLERSLPELAARGVSVGKPVPFRSRRSDGTRAILWTTVSLPSVSSEAVNVFLCEYGHDVPARRRELSEQLRSREGGPLSILSIREVVYGTTNAARLQERWQKLLNPVSATSASVWPMGAGPALRVVSADRDGIRGVVIVVKSLDQARRFLKARGLFGSDEDGVMTISGGAFRGLSVTLVE